MFLQWGKIACYSFELGEKLINELVQARSNVGFIFLCCFEGSNIFELLIHTNFLTRHADGINVNI